jgi:hypothetical protein
LGPKSEEANPEEEGNLPTKSGAEVLVAMFLTALTVIFVLGAIIMYAYGPVIVVGGIGYLIYRHSKRAALPAPDPRQRSLAPPIDVRSWISR